jgi:hypothetical protein
MRDYDFIGAMTPKPSADEKPTEPRTSDEPQYDVPEFVADLRAGKFSPRQPGRAATGGSEQFFRDLQAGHYNLPTEKPTKR